MKLSEYVRSIVAEKNLSLSDVQKRSRGAISFGYVNDLINEKSINPSIRKLQALALGLGVSEEDLFRVARGLPIEKTDNPVEVALVEKFKRLPPAKQEEVLMMLDFFDSYSGQSGFTTSDSDDVKNDPEKNNKVKPRRAGAG